jgi:pimeloyl-ACP methyl ester carboxylesterase
LTAIVLVHGAWHGAWCWYRLVPLLEAAGHRVFTPDLPGHGRDQTPLSALSMDGYAQAIAQTLQTLREPALLVGHSLGGLVVTQAAELQPERVRRLVYLTAFLPGDGDSCSRLSGDGADSLLTPYTAIDEASGVLRFAVAGARTALYEDCPAESIALASRCLRPEAILPLTQPLHLSAAGCGRIPRAYIECSNDRAIPLARQRAMQAAHPCERVVTLASAHSPFFALPEQLALALGDLAA